jgi:hypothetical protein
VRSCAAQRSNALSATSQPAHGAAVEQGAAACTQQCRLSVAGRAAGRQLTVFLNVQFVDCWAAAVLTVQSADCSSNADCTVSTHVLTAVADRKL